MSPLLVLTVIGFYFAILFLITFAGLTLIRIREQDQISQAG